MATKVQRERVLRLVSKWKPRLLLSHWSVVVTFKEEECTTAPNGAKTVAEITVDPRYTESHLNVFPALWSELRSSQEVTVIHELCHIITNPLREALKLSVNRGVISQKKCDDLVEGYTETLCKFCWLWYGKGKKSCKEHTL